MPTYSASQGYNIWMPPPSPDPRDDEFDLSLASWTLGVNTVTTAIDPYAGFAAGGDRYSNNSYRQSWLIAQAQGDATYRELIHKGVTLATNEFVWARAMATRKVVTASATNNDGSLGLTLCQTAAGLPSYTNQVSMFFVEADAGAVDVQFEKIDAGVLTVVTLLPMSDPSQYEYIGIQKLGTTYHGWAAPPSGQWRWLGSTTLAATLDRVSVRIANATTTNPGNLLTGLDFIRFRASATALP